MTTDTTEEVQNGLLTQEQVKEIEALAREEDRSSTEVVDSMLKIYRLRRLAEYGQAMAKELGLEPKSEAHAERIISKTIAESRKERGK
jgi:hypothetical protein